MCVITIGWSILQNLRRAGRGAHVRCVDRWGTPQQPPVDEILRRLSTPSAERIWYIRYALKSGMTIEDVQSRLIAPVLSRPGVTEGAAALLREAMRSVQERLG